MKAVSSQRSVVSKSIVGFALCAVLLALCYSADAQQPTKIPRIGFLTGASLSSQNARNEAFRQTLRELGYVEGKNIIIEWRSYEGKRDLLPAFAAELVRLNVDVIVAGGSGDIKATKEASATIPIVMLAGGDAVASGFIASLARLSRGTTFCSSRALESKALIASVLRRPSWCVSTWT